MKTKLWVIGILAVSLMFLPACFDGDDEVVTAPELPSTIILADGTKTVPPGGTTQLAAFSVTGPGLIIATVTWSTPPAKMHAGFDHGGQLWPSIISGSPLTYTVTVTDTLLAHSHDWKFGITNNPGAAVEVTYVITFYVERTELAQQ